MCGCVCVGWRQRRQRVRARESGARSSVLALSHTRKKKTHKRPPPQSLDKAFDGLAAQDVCRALRPEVPPMDRATLLGVIAEVRASGSCVLCVCARAAACACC